VIAAWIALAACAPPEGSDGTHHTPPDAVSIVATAIPGAAVNTLTVRWTPPANGTASWVEFGLDGALDQATPTTPAPADGVLVLGMKSNRSYAWRAVTETADGERLESPVATYDVPPPPQDLPVLTFTTEDPASVIPGRYVLVQVGGLDQSWAVILDGDGDYVWIVELPVGIQISHVAPAADHASIWISQMDRDQLVDLSRTYRYDLSGNRLSDTRLPDQHHVVIARGDTGDLVWIAHVTREIEVEPGTTWNVISDEIRTAAEGDGENYRVLFNYFDDWVPWYVPCSHVVTEEMLLGVDGYHEWTHTNSLVDAPDEDALYITPRLHDALLKIGREDGALEWQLGGQDSDFGVAPDPLLPDPVSLWSHGHLNEVWSDGFLIFDNNIHPSTGSRALEFAVDQERREAELVWSYTDPAGGTVPLLGDARRLPDGHRLVTWTTWGVMTEHTADGTILWQADTPLGLLIGRPVVLDTLYGLVEAPHE
jgi:hypothetical protein